MSHSKIIIMAVCFPWLKTISFIFFCLNLMFVPAITKIQQLSMILSIFFQVFYFVNFSFHKIETLFVTLYICLNLCSFFIAIRLFSQHITPCNQKSIILFQLSLHHIRSIPPQRYGSIPSLLISAPTRIYPFSLDLLILTTSNKPTHAMQARCCISRTSPTAHSLHFLSELESSRGLPATLQFHTFLSNFFGDIRFLIGMLVIIQSIDEFSKCLRQFPLLSVIGLLHLLLKIIKYHHYLLKQQMEIY